MRPHTCSAWGAKLPQRSAELNPNTTRDMGLGLVYLLIKPGVVVWGLNGVAYLPVPWSAWEMYPKWPPTTCHCEQMTHTGLLQRAHAQNSSCRVQNTLTSRSRARRGTPPRAGPFSFGNVAMTRIHLMCRGWLEVLASSTPESPQVF